MAYILGEAALRVYPNMETFHNQIRNHSEYKKANNESVEIKVKIDEKKFKDDLRDIKRQLKAIEDEDVLINVRADTTHANRNVNRFRARVAREPLRLKVQLEERSLDRAQRVFSSFHKDNETVDVHVAVNRHHADEEMEDFRRKQAMKPIVQNIIYNPTSMPKMPSPARRAVGGASEAMSRAQMSRIQSEGWTVVNMWGKMWKAMNRQIEAGIIDIYDPYRKAAVDIGKRMLKPFQNFNKALQESTSFTNFFAKFRKEADGTGNVFQRFAQRTRTGFSRARDGVIQFEESLRRGLRTLRAEFTVPQFFKDFPKAVASIGKTWGNWAKRAGQEAADMARSVGRSISRMTAPLRAELGRMWKVLATDGRASLTTLAYPFIALGRNVAKWTAPVRAELGRMWKVLRTDGVESLRVLGRGFQRAGKSVMNFGKRIGGVFTNSEGRLRRFGNYMLGPIRNNFSALGKFVGKSMGRVGGVVGKAFGRMGQMANSRFFKVFRTGMNMAGRYTSGFMRIAIGAFAKITGMLMGSLMPAIMAVGAGILALGAQAAIGAIAALGGAILSVAQGALLLAPAFIAAAGVSFAALKIGLEGVGDGVKAAFSAETVEDFEEAIADLPAGAQDIARAFRDSKGAMDELKESVQTALTRDLGGSIRNMMDVMMPRLTEGMTNMASSWNNSIRNLLNEMSSDQAARGMTEIMNGVTEMSREMEPVLANLARAFGSLMEQGAKFLGPMGKWIADATSGFGDWAESLKEIDESTGLSRFDTMVQNAAKNAKYLGDIFGGLFRTIGNFFAAGAEGGEGMLVGMADGMQRLADYTSRGNEGFEKMVGFMEDATEAAGKIGDLFVPLFGLAVSIGQILVRLGSGAIPGVTRLAEALESALVPFVDMAGGVGNLLGHALGSLAPFASHLGDILAPIVGGLVMGLSQVIVTIGGILDRAAPLMETLGTEVGKNFNVIGEALSEIFTALEPYLNTTLVVLNALMGPLRLVFDYVGQIGAALLEALAPLISGHDAALEALLANVEPLVHALGIGLLGVIEALRPALKAIGDGFNSILESVAPLLPVLGQTLKIAFDMIIDAINWLTPLIPPLVDVLIFLVDKGVQLLIVALEWLQEKVRVVWPIISDFIRKAIQDFIRPALDWLVTFIIETLIPWIQKILEKALPVFNGIVDVIIWAFREMVIPAFQLVVDFIKNILWPIFKWLLENVVTPIFNAIGTIIGGVFDGIAWAIENVVKPALNAMETAFEKAKNGVKTVWDTLKQIFSDPITFFIDTIINDGILNAWNKVMDFLNLDGLTFKRVRNPMKEQGFASGGVLPGYTPGRDVHDFVSPTGGRLLLSGGEAIMRPEWTKAVGGPQAVEQMNAAARNGKLRKPEVERHDRQSAAYQLGGIFPTQAFNTGGVIGAMMNIVQQKYPGLTMTSGHRPGDGGMHGAGLATDWSNGSGNTPMQLSLAHDIAQTYPGSAELIYDSPGWSGNIKNGSNVGAFGQFYTMAQAGPHHHHVHWAMTEAPTMPFGGGVFEGGSDGGGGFLSRVIDVGKMAADWVSDNIIGKIFSPFQSRIDGFTEEFGKYGNMAMGFSRKAITGVKDWAIEKIKEINPFGGGGGGGLDSPEQVEMYRPGIVAAFDRQGESALEERVAALLRQIWTESKGDPNIAQQIVDVNGTGPSAGLGLYQFIPGTFAAYRDPGLPNDRTDPEAAHNAAVRYFRDRHNWNTGPTGVGNPGRGWKTGGVLPKDLTSLFDQGGEASGTGVMRKEVIHPERVLSPNQTRAFNELVYNLLPAMAADFRRRPYSMDEGIDRLLRGWGKIQQDSDRRRDSHIDAMSAGIQGTFESRLNGTLKVNPIDTNLDRGWLDRNGSKLQANLSKAVSGGAMAATDPWAYLEAERIAKERMDAEGEEARTAASEEEQEKIKERHDKELAALDESKEEDRKALEEKHAKELENEEDLDEEEKENIRERHEAEMAKFDEDSDALKERHQAELDAVAEREKAEQERIDALKESGEYYYGYKVFGDDGSNPNEYERSESEERVMAMLNALAAPLGLEGPMGKIAEKLPVLQSIGSGIETATPAWIAALNGDPSGLQHNIAATQAAAYEQREAEFRDMGPSALAGALEMAMSTSAQRSQQPFIGEANFNGATEAQFVQWMQNYEGKKSRQKSGTIRTR